MSRQIQGLLCCLGAGITFAGFAACGSDDPGSGFTDDGGNTSGANASGGNTSGGASGGITPRDDAAASGGQPPPATPVDVVFTTDNAYVFGWGTKDSVQTLQGKPANPTAAEIFPCPVGVGPEAYVVPAESAPLDGYLYVIAWDDKSNTQGSLGQFKRRGSENVVYTGDAQWEVCATGLPYDARSPDAGGPPVDVINIELARCSAGTGDPARTSAGWVNAAGAITPNAVGNLIVGEDNSSNDEEGQFFPIACQGDDAGLGIDAAARWMWYSVDGTPRFQNDNDPRAFLIFRLPNTAVPPNPVN